MNVFIVGSGWASNAARTLRRDPRVTLRGVIGRGSLRTLSLAEELAVPAFESLEAAMNHARPDLAVVAVGDRENVQFANRLVEGGAHVLVAHPVASRVADVQALLDAAARRKVFVATDYSFRATDAHRAAVTALRSAGALLRVAIRFPGRGLPMALDLACSFAGPSTRVLASRSYPPAVAERAAASPHAFAPSVMIDHASGIVSTLTPMSHAAAPAGYQVQLGAESCRIDVELPAGAVVRVSTDRSGAATGRTLVARSPDPDPAAGYHEAIGRLVGNFVDAIDGKAELIAPLACEIDVRTAWAAIGKSLRAG
jgi:predicted dehydrogenase